MQVSERELAVLIREAVGRVVPLEFGSGFVRLKNIPQAEWAKKRVEEMRQGNVAFD